MSFTERTTCRLCAGILTEILRLADTPIANALSTSADEVAPKYPLYLSQCADCGHVQLPVEVDPALLFPADYPYVSGTSPVFVQHLAEQAAAVASYCGLERGDSVVEIGSNDGTLLRLLRERGYRMLGIDPALSLARSATESGLLTLGAAFSEYLGQSIAEDFGHAKVVFANNVLAHSADIVGIFGGIKHLLEQGGMLVLEVGYLPDVLSANNFPGIYHEHLGYWHLESLRRALGEAGLHAYHAHRVATQGGSVRVYAQKGVFSPPWSAPFVGMLDEESSLPAALKGWPSRIDAATSKLHAVLRAFKAQGKTIAGYGAAAKATTLLHQCGIGSETLDCAFDANPRKIGKFMPGLGIPIVDKLELEVRQPDYCVILSGNFSASIREQHPGFRGQWVEPLPMPVVCGEELAA